MSRPLLRWPVFAALCFGALADARAQQAAPDASSTPATAAPTPAPALVAPHIGFYTPRTVLWAGRTAVVPLKVSPAPAEDLSLTASADSNLVEILRQPAVLSGAATGYLRVRALRPGRTRIALMSSSAAVEVDIKADPAGAAFAEVDPESPRPRLVSPVADAVVWGQFAVGVDVFDGAVPPPEGVSGVASAAAGPRVQLRLPNGHLLDPVACTAPEFGPARHYQFTVNAADLPGGAAALTAVSYPAGFSDVDRLARAPGSRLESDPLTLEVRAPRPDTLTAGACADPAILGATPDLYAPARASRYGTRQPKPVDDPASASGKIVACYGSEPVWCLPFNVKDPGEYQVFIQARGDYGVGAFPTAGLYVNNADGPAATVRLAGPKFHRLPLGGPVHLDGGPQMLTVRFMNDFDFGKEDRNLFLDRYEIARVSDLPAATPRLFAPVAGKSVKPPPALVALSPLAPPLSSMPAFRPVITYPANGAAVCGADAVVARVHDSGGPRPAWMDVLVDGEPQGLRSQCAWADGQVVFPLLTRCLAPGQHRLAVRAAGGNGYTNDSPVQLLNVLPAAPAARGPYERAVFLLDRLAFGPDPRELAAVLTMGERAWLDSRLATGFDAPNEQTLLRQACARCPRLDDEGQGAARALGQWIATENPVRSRFTAWVENHFSTWINKTKPAPKWREHLDFCRLGVAPFADLLAASAHSPAMLVYLDQEKSYANKLNENYAREIMELHTLGVHGGYAQADVTALAGVLNGWTLAEEGALPQEDGALRLVSNMGNESGMAAVFRFSPVLNDGKARRVFGLDFPAADPAGRWDRVHLALEMLAAHPGTAEHVCRKLAEHYVGVPAPDPLVDALAETFLETGGDLRAVLRAMAAHPAFWNAPPKMATPFDYGVRAARLCRAAVVQIGGDPEQSPKPDQIQSFLKKSGMGLFDRVTPDGYPENSGAYVDSNALLQRWHFMEANLDALGRLVPPPWRTPPPAAPKLTPVSNDPAAGDNAADEAAQRFIDLVSVRLTGRLLSLGSNQAAREIYGEGTPDQVKQTLLLISLLPETSLR